MLIVTFIFTVAVVIVVVIGVVVVVVVVVVVSDCPFIQSGAGLRRRP